MRIKDQGVGVMGRENGFRNSKFEIRNINVSRFTFYGQKRGFTLMEVLLAIAIAAVVITIINSVFFSSHEVVRAVGAQTEVYQVARIAMDRMIKDLSCSYVPSEELSKEQMQRYNFLGEDEEDEGMPRDYISFVSAADMGMSPVFSGLCEIGYYLKESDEQGGMFSLIRREDSLPDSDVSQGGNTMEIAENLVGMDIVYIDKANQEFRTWDLLEKMSLPSQAKITITFKQGEEDIPFTCNAFLPLSHVQIKIRGEES